MTQINKELRVVGIAAPDSIKHYIDCMIKSICKTHKLDGALSHISIISIIRLLGAMMDHIIYRLYIPDFGKFQ